MLCRVDQLQCANRDDVYDCAPAVDELLQHHLDPFDGAMGHIFNAAGLNRSMVGELAAETSTAKKFVKLELTSR